MMASGLEGGVGPGSGGGAKVIVFFKYYCGFLHIDRCRSSRI